MPARESRANAAPVGWAFGASLAGVALVFLAHALYLNAVVDDAFITFRYARHMGLGQGWVWNVGEPPVEGFTSFLWVVLCALVTRFELDVARAAQAIGTLASLGTLVYTYHHARRRFGLTAPLALIPCGLLACSGPFATWAGSAMETSLFGLLVVAAAYHFTAESRRTLLVAALLLLATLTRPEGFGIFGIFALIMVLGRLFPGVGRAATGRRDLLLVVAYAIPFAVYFAWRVATFGDYLPNTFHAKTGLSVFIPVRGLLYSGYFAFFYVGPWLPLLFVAGRKGRARGEDRAARPALAGQGGERRFALTVVLAILVAYSAYIVAVGGDYMAMYRFFVPILPFVYLPIGLAAASLLEDGPRSRTERRLAMGCIAFGLALTLLHSTALDVVIFGRPRAQQGHYAGVINERYAVARFSAVGRFFDAHKRGSGEVLATRVIGAIGFYADMKVLDMFGITDRHIARSGHGTKPLGLGFPGHERSDLRYVAEQRPTYVFLELADQRRAPGYPDWGADANAILRREYEIDEARILIPGQGVGWLYFLERRRDRPPG